jgi:hypothetical protein
MSEPSGGGPGSPSKPPTKAPFASPPRPGTTSPGKFYKGKTGTSTDAAAPPVPQVGATPGPTEGAGVKPAPGIEATVVRKPNVPGTPPPAHVESKVNKTLAGMAAARAPSKPAALDEANRNRTLLGIAPRTRAPSKPAAEEMTPPLSPATAGKQGQAPSEAARLPSRPDAKEVASANAPRGNALGAGPVTPASTVTAAFEAAAPAPAAPAAPAASATAPAGARLQRSATPAPPLAINPALLDLQRRVEELEKSATPVPPALKERIEHLRDPSAHGPPFHVPAAAVTPPAPSPSTAPAPSTDGWMPGISIVPSFRPSAIPIVEQDLSLDFEIDNALDGRVRRRRIVVRLILFVLLVFGALLAAMAYSYSPQARVLRR